MLKDIARKYYEQGFNCAESIIRAGNEYYNLGLDDKACKMTAAFGGGMQVGDVCGALTGSACVVSSRYVAANAHSCPDLHPVMLKLVRAFQAKFSSRVCREIKPKFFDKNVHCENTVTLAAEVLENVLSEYDAQKKA